MQIATTFRSTSRDLSVWQAKPAKCQCPDLCRQPCKLWQAAGLPL